MATWLTMPADDPDAAWTRIEAMIETRKPGEYASAVALVRMAR